MDTAATVASARNTSSEGKFSVTSLGKFFLTAFFARTASSMLSIGLLMVIDISTGNIKQAGTIAGVYSAALAIGSIAIPWCINKWSLRYATVGSIAVFCGASMWLYHSLCEHDYQATRSAAIICGIFFPPHHLITRKALATFTTPGKERDRAFTIDSIVYDISYICAPVLVTSCMAVLGLLSPIYVAALVVILTTLLFILHPQISRLDAHDAAVEKISLRSYPWQVMIPFIFQFLIIAMCGIYETMVQQALNITQQQSWIGIILGVWTAMSVIGAIVLTRYKFTINKIIIMVISCVVMGGAIIPAIWLTKIDNLTLRWITLSVMLAISGIPFAYCQGVLNSLLDQICNHHTPIALWSYMGTALVTSYAFGLYIAGQLGDIWGPYFTLSLCSAVFLIPVNIIFIYRKKILST